MKQKGTTIRYFNGIGVTAMAAYMLLSPIQGNAHMGKYPCDYPKDIVQSIRDLSEKAADRAYEGLAAILDLAADSAYHCRKDEMEKAMRRVMEGDGEAKAKTESRDKDCEPVDGGTMLYCPSTGIFRLPAEFQMRYDLSGCVISGQGIFCSEAGGIPSAEQPEAK